MTDLRLYNFPGSSAAYRVRITMALKGIAYDKINVDLVKADHLAAEYRRVNPQGLVPALVSPDGVLTQSLAIIEYLEETHPEPRLLPKDRGARAHARALALAIAAEVHPIQNLRVRNYLRDTLHQSPDEVNTWLRHWIELGLKGFQDMLQADAGPYCMGDQVTLPDVLLAPQMGNARRYGCNFAQLARLVEIDKRLLDLPAFRDTAPPPPK